MLSFQQGGSRCHVAAVCQMGLRCAWVIVLRLVLLWYVVFKVCDVVSAVAISRLVVSHVVVSCVVVTSAVFSYA